MGGNYVKVDAKADSDALFKNPKAEAVQAEAAKNAAEAAKSRQYDAPLPERLLHWTIVLAAQGAWVGFAYSAVAKCLAPGCACSWYNLVTGFAAGLLIQGGGGGEGGVERPPWPGDYYPPPIVFLHAIFWKSSTHA